MTDIKKYCKYLYDSLYIPIYLYEQGELIDCYPDQQKNTFPPQNYLSNLWETGKKAAYILTSFYSYYGYIEIDNGSSCLVFGPVNAFNYSNDALQLMSREFAIESSNLNAFSEFLSKIPQQNIDIFINTLLFINYTINNTELTREDLGAPVGFQFDTSIKEKYSEKSYDEKEEGLVNNSLEVERRLIRYIETGNLKEIQKFSIQARNTRVGAIANNNLRQWKNMFIVLITLISRAAINGGLTPSIAYQLSNIYMQQVERLSDVNAIFSLTSQAQLDYTNRVANSSIPSTADNILLKTMQYIRENTNTNITVSDVANHVGFSRTYLSRKVKKELGFELGTFIRKCKLEEAQDLLLFSDKTLSEISNYLCFSSQSHFQKAFKEQFSITPYNYRKFGNVHKR